MDPRYPPTVTRLAVMVAVWRRLDREGGGWGWDLAPHLAGVAVPADPEADAVAAALLAAPAAGAALADRVPFATDRLHPEAPGFVAWRAALLGAGPLPAPVQADAFDAGGGLRGPGGAGPAPAAGGRRSGRRGRRSRRGRRRASRRAAPGSGASAAELPVYWRSRGALPWLSCA
ncbi:MAG: hypothetical protein R3F60_11995 [bacterium]